VLGKDSRDENNSDETGQPLRTIGTARTGKQNMTTRTGKPEHLTGQLDYEQTRQTPVEGQQGQAIWTGESGKVSLARSALTGHTGQLGQDKSA
jgi:hypothetical protein